MSVQGRRFDIQHHKSGEENKFLIPLHNVMLIICLEENVWVYVTKSILHVLCMPLTWSLHENGTAHTPVAQDVPHQSFYTKAAGGRRGAGLGPTYRG